MNHYQGHWGFNKNRTKGIDRERKGKKRKRGNTKWLRASQGYIRTSWKCEEVEDHRLKFMALLVGWRGMEWKLF